MYTLSKVVVAKTMNRVKEEKGGNRRKRGKKRF
jgi:hypothetical protein